MLEESKQSTKENKLKLLRDSKYYKCMRLWNKMKESAPTTMPP
jgi:hypothetical protein